MSKKPKQPTTYINLPKSDQTLQNSNQNPDKFENGLYGALFSQGMPGAFPGVPGTASVSQVGNIFSNLRWYFVSNFRQALSEAYCELGLVQTICDVPVEDALRGGIDIVSKQLSPEQLQELHDAIEREDDLSKVAQTEKWTRLFGGGGTMILTDQDPVTPLEVDKIDKDTPLEFRAVDMWELYFDLQNTEGYDAAIQEEKYEYYSYYGTKVHKSRVFKRKGLSAPSFLRPRLRGWGFSVVEAIVRSINQYLEGTELIYELIGEAKIDVYGIKNLTNTLLSPQGTQSVARRIQLANQQKDYQHALIMDAEDHYEQKTLTFSGLAEVMNQVRMQLASDLRMPITKLFGISSAGFNSGEDDIEVYNSMIESTIRSKLKIHILQMLELRCQKLFGFVPEDLSISFKPLRVMSSKEEQEVKTQQFTRLQQALQMGSISLEEFRDACNKENLLEIELDNSGLMEGADEVGNIPGVDEKSIDESEERESDRSNLSFMKTPTTKISKKGQIED